MCLNVYVCKFMYVLPNYDNNTDADSGDEPRIKG